MKHLYIGAAVVVLLCAIAIFFLGGWTVLLGFLGGLVIGTGILGLLWILFRFTARTYQ